MTQETTSPVLSSNELSITVDGLVRDGVLLSEIINSSQYSPEIRAEALRVMRENVLSVQAGRQIK